MNLLLLACLSISLCILSLPALKSSISCLSIKFGSFFSNDREERARWDREIERSCWQKKKEKGEGRKEQKFTSTAEDAQVKRRIEIQALHLKLSKKESTEKFLTIKCELWSTLHGGCAANAFFEVEHFYFILIVRLDCTCVWAFRHFHFFYARVSETLCTIQWIPCTVHMTHKYFIQKKWSHSTIHTFKNYFATVFSVFNFQQNKQYPNGL